MTRRFEAFLFDFGGVFTDSPFTAVEDFGRAIGADPGRVSAIVFGSYEHDGEHPWHRLERGEIALEAARESILALGREGGLEVDIYQLFARMAGNDAGAASRGVLLEAVRGLRGAGYRTGIVTNNVREFGRLARADPGRGVVRVRGRFQPRRGAQAGSAHLRPGAGAARAPRSRALRVPRRPPGQRGGGAGARHARHPRRARPRGHGRGDRTAARLSAAGPQTGLLSHCCHMDRAARRELFCTFRVRLRAFAAACASL